MTAEAAKALGSRRDFFKATTVALAGTALGGARHAPVHAAGNEVIKVALVGCGARGAAAAVQALSTRGPVVLWAMADAFDDRLQMCLRNMQRGFAAAYDRDASDGQSGRIQVPRERQFVGLDAYRNAIDSGVDVVLLVEPPGFRPKHFQYAVEAGKHVLMEKPVATDVAGVQRVMAAAELAKKQDLKIGVGLQRRHQVKYRQAIQRLHDGAIGDILATRCYWSSGPPAKTPHPRGSATELEYQVRNWYFFHWLSGDHICEQHVHNLDVCNWIKQAHPQEAQGMGGRQVRTGKEYGNIFDHHSVEFTYPDGTKMFSQCRQIPDCWSQVAEMAQGTRGTARFSGNRAVIEVHGQETMRFGRRIRPRARSPYQVEHDELFDAIRSGDAHNEAEYGAISSMTGILGRMATYSGKVVTWDEAINSGNKLTIEAENWDAEPPVLPDKNGNYAVAIPGLTRIV